MSRNSSPPDFDAFLGWLAANIRSQASSEHSQVSESVSPQTSEGQAADTPNRYETLLAAARVARDEMLLATAVVKPATSVGGTRGPHLEVLQLLAAADTSDSARPPELMTARGFRVTLAYDEGTGSESASICVLVRCPPELIQSIQGETAFLWNGAERFELGQFDSDGKAIGTLPAGIEISLSDFAVGKVKLEEPPPATDG